MRSIFSFLFLLFFLSHFSCNQNDPQKTKSENWDVKNTEVIESYDEVNKLPIKMAQDSLKVFLDLFSNKQKNNFDFEIKSKYTDGKEIENMWSSVDSIKADTLFTTLDNVPLRLATVKLNDMIKVAKKDIEDWTIYQEDSLLLGDFMKRYRKAK